MNKLTWLARYARQCQVDANKADKMLIDYMKREHNLTLMNHFIGIQVKKSLIKSKIGYKDMYMN